MFDKKLAEAVRSEIVRIVAEHQAEIQRKAVMSVDNPLLANEILKDRLNEASAYFANFFDTIRFETAVERSAHIKGRWTLHL